MVAIWLKGEVITKDGIHYHYDLLRWVMTEKNLSEADVDKLLEEKQIDFGTFYDGEYRDSHWRQERYTSVAKIKELV